jgi:2-methylisocitrate lyase-like PEP mutase family enzyme
MISEVIARLRPAPYLLSPSAESVINGVEMSQADRAAHFRRLHNNRPLILPNGWDAASARVIELAGAPAIASTSAGVSWAHGRADGQKLERGEMIEAIRRMVQAVTVPLTADIEGGYGSSSSSDVAETVRAVIGAGAVGINLEDSPGSDGRVLLVAEKQAERIQAARAAAQATGIDLVINARTDVYLMQAVPPEARFDETVRRGKLYLAAGADCLFVPGVIDGERIGALVKAIEAPLNIMAGPGAPTMQQLGQLGVARVSVGPASAQAALGITLRAARELLDRGTYGELGDSMPFGEVNGMWASRRFAAGL